MELHSSAHVRLARAALASGSPDALEALARAATAPDPALRQAARATLIAEARARGVAGPLPDEGAGAAEFTRLRDALAAAFIAAREGA
jgi:hypothetical protein